MCSRYDFSLISTEIIFGFFYKYHFEFHLKLIIYVFFKGACQNGATCIDNGGPDYKCVCPPGYIGKNCEGEILKF